MCAKPSAPHERRNPMKLGFERQREICERRGWHRCREIENPPDVLHQAVCISCAANGTIAWAAINLLKEHAAEEKMNA